MTQTSEGVGFDDRLKFNTPGPTYQEILDGDRHPVPEILRRRSPWPQDIPSSIPKSIYLSQEFHDLEAERLWGRVWQVACRLEHIPRIGDSVLYTIADREYIVVRAGTDTVKAFPNSCLHRGRRLREGDGQIARIRCPFHGFCWELDGRLANIPTKWDFTHVAGDDLSLPEAKVAVWGGFVFINPEPECEPLEDFLGGFGEHFERFPVDDWYTRAHAAAVIDCNWKIVVEAFIEASHVYATHPQTVPGNDPCNSQYDIWDNFARVITPVGLTSGLIKATPDEQAKMNAMMGRTGKTVVVEVPDGLTARQTFADLQRSRLRKSGSTVEFCDSEMVDLQTYWLFPNLLLLGGARGLYLRFRPHGSDPNKSIMEMAILAPPKGSGEQPAPAPVQWLEPGQTWSDVPGLADYALFDQDHRNLAQMQQGLRNNPDRPILLSNYQESTLGYFYQQLARTWLGQDL